MGRIVTSAVRHGAYCDVELIVTSYCDVAVRASAVLHGAYKLRRGVYCDVLL